MDTNEEHRSEVVLSDIEKGQILESVLWGVLRHYIASKYTIDATLRLGWQHGAKDVIRYLTRDGHTIELLWLRPDNHDPGSHKPDFLIRVDSQPEVVIEAKNWAPPPGVPRIMEEILTRYLAFKNAPYKILVITTPIRSTEMTLLTEENIVAVVVYPQILSRQDLPQVARIKSALLSELP